MKYASDALISFLDSGSTFLMADLYAITLRGSSSVIYLTNSDRNITYGGNIYLAPTDSGSVVGVSRGSIRHARGTEVATVDVTLQSAMLGKILSANAALAAINGAFDAARVRIDRLFMEYAGDTSLGTVCLFEGNCAGVDPYSTKVVLHVKSDMEILQLDWPRIVCQAGCANIFGDAGCGIDLSSLAISSVLTGTPTATSLPTGLTQATDYFTNGWILMTSGAASGSRRVVSAFSSETVTVSVQLPETPAAGDTFTIYPGCARTVASCKAWSNINNYAGFPYVPESSTTVG